MKRTNRRILDSDIYISSLTELSRNETRRPNFSREEKEKRKERKRKPVRFFLFARQRRISKRRSSDAASRVLASRINEPGAFILLLKRPFECAERQRESESTSEERYAWVMEKRHRKGRKERWRGRTRRTFTAVWRNDERRERGEEREADASSRWKAMPVNESINNWFGNLQTKPKPTCRLVS